MRRFLAASLLVGIVSGCGNAGSTISPSPATTQGATGPAASVPSTVVPTVLPTGPGESRPTQPTDWAAPLALAGNGVIALAKDGDILVADRPGGDLRPLVAGPEYDANPRFSPDGTRLAFTRYTELESFLMIADADGTNVVQIFPDSWDGDFAPDWESLVGIDRIDGQRRIVIRPVDPAAALTVVDIRLPTLWEGSDRRTFRPTNPQEILFVAQPEPGDPSGMYPRGIYVYDHATGGIRTIVEPVHVYVDDVAWMPDGEHIIYNLGLAPRIVAADGSGDQAFDALRGRVGPFSNDGTRIVADRGEGVAAPRLVIVPINGDGEPVVLACGPGTDIGCPWSWTWSPDDSMLIGEVSHEETTSSGETSGWESTILVDAHTGQVTELDWIDVSSPAWQRVAP